MQHPAHARPPTSHLPTEHLTFLPRKVSVEAVGRFFLAPPPSKHFELVRSPRSPFTAFSECVVCRSCSVREALCRICVISLECAALPLKGHGDGGHEGGRRWGEPLSPPSICKTARKSQIIHKMRLRVGRMIAFRLGAVTSARRTWILLCGGMQCTGSTTLSDTGDWTKRMEVWRRWTKKHESRRVMQWQK
jgi:hypothetical protein